jgi:DNA repair protein RecO (recombination protein O)
VKPEHTKGIVLSRTDYGEADRIVTVITPDKGKRRLMVKGVRKMKSKMAGGIELFSVSELSYIKGKGEIDTLISARLEKYYSNIVQDIDRVQLGYEIIKTLNRATEDQSEEDYFDLLEAALKALDTNEVSNELIRAWFQAQLLRLAGHTPNLITDTKDQKLQAQKKYNFDFEEMTFTDHTDGQFASDHIKILRILFSHHRPAAINKVSGTDKLLPTLGPLIQTMLQSHIRI